MSRLKTAYAGLTLSSPIIVASSGLTNSVTKIKELEAAGAGAVVLKSLFEEQILMQAQHIESMSQDYPEAADYIHSYVKANDLSQYLTLISDAKRECKLPIIASINCYENSSWEDFARDIEQAGADAIELNIQTINTTITPKLGEYEARHLEIINRVKQVVNIPVIAKIGQRFSNLISLATQLKANGADAVVLFNRFNQPDIDIEKLEITSSTPFSHAGDFSNTLRWIGIVSGRTTNIDLAASTGVWEVESPIKAILAGATAVQVCSIVYKKGATIITEMNTALEQWMDRHNFETIAQCKGMLNLASVSDITMYERVQFMKHYSNKEW